MNHVRCFNLNLTGCDELLQVDCLYSSVASSSHREVCFVDSVIAELLARL
jgi:hypothetical protein